jgi:antitoxin VapB
MSSTTARTFKSGNSEAVRLPKGFGFGPGKQVRIEREGDRVVLTLAKPERDWKTDAANLMADIRAIVGPEGLPREERDVDWWPDRG